MNSKTPKSPLDSFKLYYEGEPLRVIKKRLRTSKWPRPSAIGYMSDVIASHLKRLTNE